MTLLFCIIIDNFIPLYTVLTVTSPVNAMAQWSTSPRTLLSAVTDLLKVNPWSRKLGQLGQLGRVLISLGDIGITIP